MTAFPWLTILMLIPLFGGCAVLCAPKVAPRAARNLALAAAALVLGVTILIWINFDPSGGLMRFVERWAWIPSLGIEYHTGIDGLGLLMVLLAAIITPFGMLASSKIEANAKLYFALMLFLESALIGTFTALNFFHWFIFWELSLVPAFFLIKIWGGPSRTKAAYQLVVYTMVGSVTMLLAFVAIYAALGTFDFAELTQLAQTDGVSAALFAKLGGGFWKSKEMLAALIFFGAFLGFAVKVPLIPFHTWLPLAYAEAPIGTSIVLTGAMSKMGVYGFLRILLPIFPDQMRAMLTPLLFLAVVTIIFSAATAFVQKDLKRIAAYSSINHLGYCLLGVFAAAQATGVDARWTVEKAAALNGVILQMFNHGLTAAAMFYFVGLIEQRSGGLRGLNDFGGLRKAAPIFCGLMGITLFASLGLPGLNGFVGEFLIFKGVFSLSSTAAAFSTIGLLLTAIFLLAILRRVFNGPIRPEQSRWMDLTMGERITVIPLISLMFLLGIYPQCVIGLINPAVAQMVKHLSY